MKPFEFECVGPERGGRVTAVAGIAAKPNTYYMGATGGGVWKTEDYGHHWRNISNGYFASPSIGAIAVAESDPDIVYAGTGSDGIRSNVIVGKGIYKSVDAGESWEFSGLPNAGQIGAILIHPTNPDIAYAAVIGHPFKKSAERGVYRTLDGGAGWENIYFHSDSVGCVDLEFAPDDPDILYAAMWRGERKPWTIISGGATDGIFKSTDRGESWERKTTGLPSGMIGKIDFAVSAQKPERVWALIQASGGEEGVYRSDDYGESWAHVTMPDNVHKSVMYRPFYFTNIHANPQNADNIWSGTKQYWTSFDGGNTWRQMPITHADHHDLWINPADSLLMVEGNDGGAAVSIDGGHNWSTVFNQPTAELYSCHVDDQYPYYLYSGQQDNTTIRVPSEPPYLDVLNSNDNHGFSRMMFWERMGGCETGPVIPKPGDPDIIYANCKGKFSVYNLRTGLEQNYFVGAESLYGNHPDSITYRFQRVTPMEVSPHDPNTVYYGSQFVHKTNDGGIHWQTISPDLTANREEYRMRSGGPIDEDISGEEYYNVLYAIEESTHEQGVIWTGSNDGVFHISRDGGHNWKNITPNMPWGGRVQNIELSPHKPGKAYYAVNRDFLGDEQPYIYKTEDYGETWSRITDGVNGIPADFPARVVREDPDRAGLLYAGTEFGLFVSFDDGQSWHEFQQNLPVVPITDLRVHRQGLALSTLGRSFWTLEDVSALHTIDPGENNPRLFKPRSSFGSKVSLYFMVGEGTDDSTFNFKFLREGKLIHEKEENLSEHPPGDWGLRRTEWDLRYYFPNGERDFKGPMVAPGRYQVILSSGGKEYKQTLHYQLHPELAASGTTVDDLGEQEKLAVDVALLLLDIKKEIRMLEKKIEEKADEKLKTRLNRLKKGPGRYDKPMIHEHVEYLYEMISEAPQKVGRDAHQRYSELKTMWERMKDERDEK